MSSRAGLQTLTIILLVFYFESFNCLIQSAVSPLDVNSQIIIVQNGTWNKWISINKDPLNNMSQGKRGQMRDSGYWHSVRPQSISLSIDGENHLYSYSESNKWFIHKLNPNGTIGEETEHVVGEKTEHGFWEDDYPLAFSLNMNNRTFVYSCCGKSGRPYIQEVRGGKKKPHIAESADSDVPLSRTVFPYTLGGRHFFYRHRFRAGFVQELLHPIPKWPRAHPALSFNFVHTEIQVAFPFQINGRQFFYRHRHRDHFWAIQELLPDGQFGNKTDEGYWNAPHDAAFHFTIRNEHYFYRQSKSQWHIQRLLAGGEMGDETDQGPVEIEFPVKVPYAANGRTFFYASNPKSRYWCIYELL